jgi:polysaccharide export outer membrane protein
MAVRKERVNVVRRTTVFVLTILWSFGAIGAGQAQNQQPAALGRNQAPPDVAPKLDTRSPEVDPHTYSIGTGDVLFVKVWREMDFTGPYTVRPDGKITIPLVGDVQAAGLTPERLGDQLKQALADYINSPDVSVSLQQINSKKFFITGEVNRPGEFVLTTPTRVFDALANASGFRDFANKKKIVIIRGAERIKFNYADVLKGKDLDQNIFVENGDTIVVP